MKGSRTKYSSGFDPKTIPGCSLWLDAADRTTLSFSGSNVTQWRDKSGTGNHYATGGAITHSNNALVFPGNATLSNTNPINFSAGTTPSMSTFVVVSTPDGSQERGIFQYGQVSCSKTGYAVYVFVGNEIHCTLYCGDLSVRNAIQTNARMLVSDVVSYSGTPGSLSRAGWFNGAPMSATNATTTGVNLNLNSSSVIGNVSGGFWNGTMHEILYFNRALSTVERQQVEGYLSRKWTLTQFSLLTSPHPYLSLGPVGFLPTSFPGCALWLDAADSSTLTLSGSTVAAWADKSGNGRNATQSVAGQRPTFASSTVSFNGANSTVLALPNNTFPSGNSAYSMYFVITPRSSDGVLMFSGTQANSEANAIYYNLSTGRFYNYWWNADAVGGVPINGTRILLEIIYTQNVARYFYQNGALDSTTASSNRNSGISNNYLGAEVLRGYYSTCDINEVLVYSTDSTTAQRQQIEGYLAAKWGTLTTGAAVPAAHPYATFPPTLRPFGPTDVSGCILWLDAADRKTLFQDSGGTQPITAVGQSIGLWRDKSGRGYLMTVPSGKSAPTYGQNVINTTGTNALWSTTNFELTGNAKLTLFFVFASSVASGYNTSCAAWIGNPNGPVGGKIIGLGIAVQGLPSEYVYFVPSTFSSAELSSTQSRLVGVPTLTMAKYDGASVFGNYNGTPLAPSGIVAAGGANWSALPFQTGLRSANAGGSADGFMCEVLCYNDALSTLQIQQIEGYLARKWGLNSSVAVGHPYRFGLPPLTAGFTPRALTGCALWLDAADASTLTLSGSNVTAWADKSGNGRTATAQSAASYSAANNALTFTSGNYYSFSNLSFAVNSYFSFFIVERLQSSSSLPHLLGTDATGDNQSLHVRYNGTGNGSGNASAFRFAFYNNDLDAQNIPAFTTATAQPIRVWSLVFTTSFRGIYLNGTLMTSDANNTKLSSWNTPLIGRSYGGYYYTGLIYELLGFGGQLSTAQRQQVEGYLAWKWGLQDSLPGGHPFRMLKP
jgi:hypothetical protein